MDTGDYKILCRLREQIERLQIGEAPEPIACDSSVDPIVADLCREINKLTTLHCESLPFIRALANGNLDIEPPPKNLLVSPFKQLHACLRHLTWQTGQIAAGDYGQRVDFMGAFSVAFNSMVDSLKEKRLVEEALRENEKRMKLVLEGSNDGFWDWNIATGAVSFSRRYAEMIGFSQKELEPSVASRRKQIHPDDWAQVENKLNEHLAGASDSYEAEFRLLTKTGEWEWVLERGKIVARGDSGEPLRMAGTTSIITERKRQEEKLNYVITHDSMTGLFNRTYFDAELARLAKSRQYPISIVMADVDGLKLVNDSFGHQEGDQLIKLAATALQKSFRPEDVVARIGGDEFAILLPNTNADVLKNAVKRVLQYQAAINSEDRDYTLSISIGSATAEQSDQFKEALHLADSRMYYYKFQRKTRRQ